MENILTPKFDILRVKVEPFCIKKNLKSKKKSKLINNKTTHPKKPIQKSHQFRQISGTSSSEIFFIPKLSVCASRR